MAIHQYPLLILEAHLDSFGHVNNGTYLQLFEEARWDFITHRGYGLKRVHETGLSPVMLEIHLKFRNEIQLREKVIIQTNFIKTRSKIGVFQQEIINEGGKQCCSAEFTFGIFDLKARKLVAPNEEWLYALGVTSQT